MGTGLSCCCMPRPYMKELGGLPGSLPELLLPLLGLLQDTGLWHAPKWAVKQDALQKDELEEAVLDAPLCPLSTRWHSTHPNMPSGFDLRQRQQ